MELWYLGYWLYLTVVQVDMPSKIWVINGQKIIEIPGSRIKSLDNISLIVMVNGNP